MDFPRAHQGTCQQGYAAAWMRLCIVALILFGHSAGLLAQEIILIPPPESKLDKRYEYSEALLKQVLERTAAKYGKAELKRSLQMKRNRVLLELQKGNVINVADAPTRPDFEQRLLPIRIPLRKGLLGYRLFLIREQDKNKFATIKSMDELKQLRAGSGTQWSITDLLRASGFKLETDPEYENLFHLLANGGIDYFPRGANEIFEELDNRKLATPNLYVEPNLAIYIPLPTYFFVTPTKPKLAARIQEGLELMLQDGSFDKLFYQYHDNIIKRADLAHRHIFYLDNPTLSPATPLQRKQLWLKDTH